LAGLFFWLSQNNAFAANQAIISYSSRSYAFLPAQVAVAQNFFRDENLEALLIQMRSQVTVPALISGEVQYTLSFGNIIGSAMQGLPFKILAVLTDKPLHSLVGRPEIKSISELRGKRIGTQRIGGSDQLAAEAILQAKGIDPKEVQFVTLGGDEPVRVEILKKGLVDAICTVPPVVPPPASEPIVSELVTSSLAPATLAIVTAPALLIAFPLRSSSVPALMVVMPV